MKNVYLYDKLVNKTQLDFLLKSAKDLEQCLLTSKKCWFVHISGWDLN